jgi:hypothetical protein
MTRPPRCPQRERDLVAAIWTLLRTMDRCCGEPHHAASKARAKRALARAGYRVPTTYRRQYRAWSEP